VNALNEPQIAIVWCVCIACTRACLSANSIDISIYSELYTAAPSHKPLLLPPPALVVATATSVTDAAVLLQYQQR
jgi:hypothetical protein